MAYTDYFDEVQSIYIAYYQRPADPAGLRYWAQRLNAEGGNLDAIIDAFSNSPEAKSLYTETDPLKLVDSVYQALFGRPADNGADNFYVKALEAGKFPDGRPATLGRVAIDVLNGAQGDDRVAIDNKLKVANDFTQIVDGRPLTDPEFGFDGLAVTYKGDADAAAAREFLKGVTSDPSTVPTQDGVKEVVAEKIADPTDAPVETGKTFMLTANLDAPGALAPSINTQGTAGNDLYKGVIDAQTAANTTLQSLDDIDGAGGIDTLQIISNGTAANTVTPLFLKNVEKVSVKDVDAPANTTVNLVNATGVTEVINDGSVAAVAFQNIGTAAVTVQKVATAVGTTFTRGQAPVTADLTLNLNTLGSAAAAGNVAAVQAGAVASNDGNNDAVNVTVNAKGYVSVASLNVTGTAVANTHTAQTVTIDAAGMTIFGAAGGAVDITGFDTTKAGKIVVKGAGAVQLNDLAGAVKTVDASANTGGVTLVGTVYTGTEAVAAAAPGLNITGGSGNDSISVDGVASAVVNAGAGNDTVTLTTAHAAGAKIDGGEGTDRIVLTSAMAAALDDQTAAGTALRATLTGFEQIGIANALAADFDVAQAGSYNYLALNGDVTNSGAAVAVSGFTTGATVEFRHAGNQTAAINIGMTGAAESSTDVVNLKLNADLANAANHTVRAGVQGINNVNVDANDRVNSVLDDDQAAANAKDNTADDGYTLILTNAANVNNLTITGTSAVRYTLQAGTDAIKLIDASASTGNVTINVSAFAGTERVEIKGSQGTNIITGDDAAFGEKITGGAANDIITAGAGADDVTGNGGRDAFVVNAGDARGVTAATVDQISDFGKVTVAATGAEVTGMGGANDAAVIAAFQAAATARGGDNADLLAFNAVAQTSVASAKSAADDAAINTALEALDLSDATQWAGKVVNATIAKGMLTVGGANAADIDTLAEWVAVADVAAETAGETVAFAFNGNTYVFQQQTAGDELVELTGTTGVTGVVLVGGAVAAAAGDIFIV